MSPARRVRVIPVPRHTLLGAKLLKLCTLEALELKFLSLSVGSFKELMIFKSCLQNKRIIWEYKGSIETQILTYLN